MKVYVANQFAIIKNLSNVNDWRYASTTENPADCASRGLMPEQLVDHELWWKGPQWLQSTSVSWPTSPNQIFREEINSTKVSAHNRKTKEITAYSEILKRFSKLYVFIRVTSCVFRFHNNIKLKQGKREVSYL